MIKNTAGQKIGAQMVSATDGSAFTGSVTVSVTIDAGTQATGSVGSGACTHEGNGYHTYAPAQAETNGTLIAFTFTGTGAVPATVQVFTTGYDPTVANLPANVKAISDDTTAADNLELAADGTGYNLGGGSVVAASVTGAVGSVTGAVGSVTGNVGGNVTGSVGSVAGAVASVTGNVGGNVVGSVASVTAGVTVTTNNDKTGYSLASGPLDAAATRAALGLASANLDTQLTTIDDFLDTEVAAIKAKTDQLTFTTANRVDATAIAVSDKTGYSIASGGIGSGAIAAAEQNALADAFLDRNMATGTDNGTNSTAVRTVRQALRRMRNKESIAAGTLTVTKEDDSTTSWTAAVTTTAGDPLSAVDPT